MPELPEVQTVVSTLRPRITGQTVSHITLHRTDILSPQNTDLPALLTGRTITHIDRRAKRILFTLDNANRFYIHLGMTGQLTIDPPATPVRNHTHLILHIADLQLRFRDPRRFGGVFWLGQEPPDQNLGPEPLTLTPKRLAQLLASTRRPIKSALLDQRLIAGLGNIYADEALFAAHIHPLTQTHRLTPTQIRSLNTSIKRVLTKAIKHRGSTLQDFIDPNGQSGTYRSRHNVYDKQGHPCPRCKRHKIQRIVLTGRSTCFCPKCQRK